MYILFQIASKYFWISIGEKQVIGPKDEIFGLMACENDQIEVHYSRSTWPLVLLKVVVFA